MSAPQISRRCFGASAAVALASIAPDASARSEKRRSPYRTNALLDHHGRSTSLAAQARAHRLVVVVMKGTWCHVCIGQLQRLATMRRRLRDLRARVVGLSVESPARNRKAARARAAAVLHRRRSHPSSRRGPGPVAGRLGPSDARHRRLRSLWRRAGPTRRTSPRATARNRAGEASREDERHTCRVRAEQRLRKRRAE